VKHSVHPSDLAPGLMLGQDVELGEELDLGAWVVIHSGTVVGDRCQIQDCAVLGKHARLGARSTAPRGSLEALRLEADAVVCAGAIVYAGARVGAGAIVGDQAQVRERTTIGAGSVVGRGTGVDNDVTIGAGVRIQSNCYLAAHAVVEDDAFLGPAVVTTNDDTAGRRDADDALEGPIVRRGARVGAGAILRPGVVVGEDAFVGAGAVVTRDVPDRTMVIGVPARVVREVAGA
jgi:acetyltransferase-like isoleucine patch superfamily enzyme